VPKATLAAVTLIALFFRADIMGVCAADIVATAQLRKIRVCLSTRLQKKCWVVGRPI